MTDISVFLLRWPAALPRRVRLSCYAFFLACMLASPASAGFVGGYAIGNFSLVNTDADGTTELLNSGSAIRITGGNQGTGVPGHTDLTIASLATGFLTFHYSYYSFDEFPAYDSAGYLLRGTFIHLADSDGMTGAVSVPVMAGDVFGWRVMTLDNIGEPGVLEISGFSAPGGASVPEPATSTLILIAAVGTLAARHRSRRPCMAFRTGRSWSGHE